MKFFFFFQLIASLSFSFISRTKVTSKVGAMAAFTKKKMSCIGCKVPLKVETDAVCDHCRAKEGEIYQKEIASVATLEERFNQLWTQCQRCQVNYWLLTHHLTLALVAPAQLSLWF